VHSETIGELIQHQDTTRVTHAYNFAGLKMRCWREIDFY